MCLTPATLGNLFGNEPSNSQKTFYKQRYMAVVSDKFEPVSARTVRLILMPRQDRATQPERRSGGAVEFEIRSSGKAAFLMKVVVNGSVNGGEFLQTSHAPEAKHGSFSSSERQM